MEIQQVTKHSLCSTCHKPTQTENCSYTLHSATITSSCKHVLLLLMITLNQKERKDGLPHHLPSLLLKGSQALYELLIQTLLLRKMQKYLLNPKLVIFSYKEKWGFLSLQLHVGGNPPPSAEPLSSLLQSSAIYQRAFKFWKYTDAQ